MSSPEPATPFPCFFLFLVRVPVRYWAYDGWALLVRILNFFKPFSFNSFLFLKRADFRVNFERVYLTQKNSEKCESFCNGFVLKFSIQWHWF